MKTIRPEPPLPIFRKSSGSMTKPAPLPKPRLVTSLRLHLLKQKTTEPTSPTSIIMREPCVSFSPLSLSRRLRMQEASSQSCPPLPLRSFLHHPKTTDICCVFQPRIMQVPHSPSSYILRAGADIVCNFFVCLTNFMRY